MIYYEQDQTKKPKDQQDQGQADFGMNTVRWKR